MSFRKRLICEHAAARITRETGVRVTFRPMLDHCKYIVRNGDHVERVRYAREAERVAYKLAKGA